MAYNLIAKPTGSFDWNKLHDFVADIHSEAIEVFPILAENNEDQNYLGISIPFNMLDQDPDFWERFLELVNGLTHRFGFKLFDLYLGTYIDESNLAKVKKSMFT